MYVGCWGSLLVLARVAVSIFLVGFQNYCIVRTVLEHVRIRYVGVLLTVIKYVRL
jgi:hypothetical protein